ncbi:MAG: hypothetical protein HKN42_03480 [Granulosicoccus sp.]|nr:hypothetical protein [Granulosicoccus sp.]
MPIENLVLMLLIGIVIGAVAGVVLRGHGMIFVVNMVLGTVGASLGAFFPVIIGSTLTLNVDEVDYLLRALFGAFLLVLLAGLFRSAKPRGAQ